MKIRKYKKLRATQRTKTEQGVDLVVVLEDGQKLVLEFTVKQFDRLHTDAIISAQALHPDDPSYAMKQASFYGMS